MKNVRFLIIFIIITLTINKLSAQTFATDNPLQSIPLKNFQHIFYVEVIINNKRANLIIDTGAAYTLIDITQAKKYGFKIIDTDIELVGLGGKRKRYAIKDCVVLYDEFPLMLKTYGADMKNLTDSFYSNGLSILGVIGSDYFTMTDAVIDYKNKILLLHSKNVISKK